MLSGSAARPGAMQLHLVMQGRSAAIGTRVAVGKRCLSDVVSPWLQGWHGCAREARRSQYEHCSAANLPGGFAALACVQVRMGARCRQGEVAVTGQGPCTLRACACAAGSRVPCACQCGYCPRGNMRARRFGWSWCASLRAYAACAVCAFQKAALHLAKECRWGLRLSGDLSGTAVCMEQHHS